MIVGDFASPGCCRQRHTPRHEIRNACRRNIFEALLKMMLLTMSWQDLQRVDTSWIRKEMEVSQNFHTNISNSGLPVGSIKYGMAKVFGPGKIKPAHEDHTQMATLKEEYGNKLERPEMVSPGRYADLVPHYGDYIIDKLTGVFLSGSEHDEHQPCHLVVDPVKAGFAPDHCVTRCTE